jgi:protein-S-isoprenylcysteine O-methyltransferase Ste14
MDADRAYPDRESRDTPGVVAPPPLIFLVPLAAGVGLRFLFPVPFLVQWLAYCVGGLLVAVWAGISWAAEREFRRARTSIRPTVPTTALVVSGPFRFTRNPLYLGMVCLYLGIAVILQAIWALIALPLVLAVMHRGVIQREERYLERKFGQTYIRYRSTTRRWL